ncbi:PQ loop repeat protein [Pyrenochaeta sp. MPI-SDFR-AT-0127]|nr:PQ loop repeat protein [Pyrenochaeta sp. MPI-SDFR-AT-0127]
MGFINEIVKNVAPIFIATSPITSYGDQIYSMHRTRSSAGFSLDIPLIMLVASILKVYYWFGARFSTSLLVQALLMIVVHLLLLHVALSNRPAPSHLPFQAQASNRPYDFWQWRSPRPYWTFVTYFTGVLLVLHLLMSSTPFFVSYTDLLGMIALTIEATLPLPQLLANWQRKGCKGFRPSVIVNWVIGDTFKMWFFFASSNGEVPLAFKVCGVFQACCDLGLAGQYLMWGDGPPGVDGASREKEVRSPLPEANAFLSDQLGEKAVGVDIEMDEGHVWERPRAA